MLRHEREVEGLPMGGEGVVGVAKKILIGPRDGYEGYLRVFTLEPGGRTPDHSHPWYHANYILEGRGVLRIEDAETEIEAGSVAYVEPGRRHNFRNTGSGPLRFICLVPLEGDRYEAEAKQPQAPC